MFNVQVVDLGCIYREEGALFLFPAADGSVPTGHFLDAPTQPAALRCGVPSWYLRLLQRQNSLKEQNYSIPYTAHSVSVGLYFVNWPFLVLANEYNLPYPKYLQGGSSDRFLSPFGQVPAILELISGGLVRDVQVCPAVTFPALVCPQGSLFSRNDP